jgi:predicted MPP superfamily phosphohydrolase
LSLLSLFNGQRIVVKSNNCASPKLTRPFRLVQLSDVHIGSRSGRYLTRVVDRVNALGPDAVVITGDLVDTETVGEAELAALKKVGAPTFLSIGNHERYVGLDALQPLVESLGVTVLRQASQVIGEIQLIGIDDAESADQVAVQLPLIERCGGKYNVLLYHRPLGWLDAFAGGIDLMLSGHTHNGQIFPFNWLVRAQFSRIHGLYPASSGAGQHYVSPGTGTWGPVMRLGSHNEITVFDLGPTGDA